MSAVLVPWNIFSQTCFECDLGYGHFPISVRIRSCTA